jgi:hypothetical protein
VQIRTEINELNSEELFSILKANGLNVIRISETSYDDSMIMDGNLEDFINSAKVLNENTVFVRIRKLEDEDFYYDIDSDENIPDGIYTELRNAPPVGLVTVLPELRSYKKYLNKEGAFLLSIFAKNRILQYRQPEKWWVEFQELRERAKVQILSQENLRIERLEEENTQRDQELLDKLSKLIEDSDFVRLFTRKDATQRAMRSYALEAIPELQELSPQLFNYGIQQLNDRVRAKKTLKK